tara:strand:+ start:517 stop:810 length:294 start_codon:yes stop_codon:yes gene_type:complete
MKKIKEEIGRNFHTDDPGPVSFDYDPDIDVDTFATDRNTWRVSIKVKSAPTLSLPAREFQDEMMAHHYARQQVAAIKNKLNNLLMKEYVKKILQNVL